MSIVLGLACFFSAPAMAQSEKTVNKAEKLIGPDESVENVRRGFQMLSDELRDKPEQASPAGLWLRGDAAALLALDEKTGLASALVALESYERSVQMAGYEREMEVFARLEAYLHDRAQSHDAAKTQAEALEAVEASLLYLRADEIRVALDLSRPVERARRHILAVSASLSAGDVRAARKQFEELDAMGGFIEELAIEVARKLEEQDSPHQAFLFMLAMQERHPSHRALLRAFTDLCLQNGWQKEAREALEKSVPFYKKTYEDQMQLAGYYDALGEPEKAVTHYENALQHAPRGFDANFLYAGLLQRIAEAERAKDPESAKRRLERARLSLLLILESNPDSKDAQMALKAVDDGLAGGDQDGAAEDAPQ
ncbi:MAG: hypothetical protein H6737_02510 [Alphaproteobacteria bacterium]|nr:hypothetical protein [Alphaproteobacteria bacterium]